MISVRQKVICSLLIAISFSSLVFINLFSGESTQYDIEVGQVSPDDIYATRNITDSYTTALRKSAAADSVADIYVTDEKAAEDASGEADKLIGFISDILSDSDVLDKREKILSDSPTELSDELIEQLLLLDSDSIDSLADVPSYIKDVMDDGVTDKDEALEKLDSVFSDKHFSEDLSSVSHAIAEMFVFVNSKADSAATDAAKEAAAAAVPDVTYMKNQTIVSRGEVVNQAQYNMLKELGFVSGSGSIDVFRVLSVVLLFIFAVLLPLLYYIFKGRFTFSASPVTVTIISCALAVIGSILASLGSSEIYIMPLSLCPALIALLLGSSMASIVNFSVALTVFFETGDASVALACALSGVAAAMIFSRVRRRGHLLAASVSSSLIYGILYAAFYIGNATSWFGALTILSRGCAGAFFGSILTIGTIPFWEAIFDVITPMKLGELSNPEHKLLKKLMQKAPGSYHHSLTVANMADSAAAAIGANALLCRVGAYYHDIGKMNDPLFFKENQINIMNPHDSLPPEESAKIIIKHVKDGAALADSYHLPKAVKNIILRHHGTTTASYFLYKAKEQNENVDTTLFTYPGPTPETKEETIIMLADACEAAVRAIRETSDKDARDIVEEIVSSRLSEQQLSSSSLSFSDLEKVKDSFAKTLDQYFHKRIIYPQNKETEIKNG
jgi:hypothetical protein